MVKLPENESYVSSGWEEWTRERNNRHVYRNSRQARLVEIEQFANLAADYMISNTMTNTNYSAVRQIAMNQLRHFFNLEFKMLCDVCGTVHYQDEISAPER